MLQNRNLSTASILLAQLALAQQQLNTTLDRQQFILDNEWLVTYEMAHECKVQVAKLVEGQSQSEVNMLNLSGDFLQIGRGTVDDDKGFMLNGNVKSFPEKQTQSQELVCHDATQEGNAVTIFGSLLLNRDYDCPVHKDFSLTFKPDNQNSLSFEAKIPGAHSDAIGSNYMAFNFDSPVDEEIYGMGLEYTVWDFKGHAVPLISDEAGVGRGLEPISSFLNLFEDG